MLVWLPDPFSHLLSSYILAMLFYFIPTHSKPLHCIFFSKHNTFHVCSNVTKFFSFFLLDWETLFFFFYFFSDYESPIDWILTLKGNIPDTSSQVYLSLIHLLYLRNKCLGGEKMHQNNSWILTLQWSVLANDPSPNVWCESALSLSALEH